MMNDNSTNWIAHAATIFCLLIVGGCEAELETGDERSSRLDLDALEKKVDLDSEENKDKVDKLEKPTSKLPELSISEPKATEGQPLNFEFTLSEISDKEVTVVVNSTSGTATSPEDFVEIKSLSVKIPAGEKTYVHQMNTVVDSIYEGNETFELILSEVSGARLKSEKIVATIEDAAPIPSLTFDSPEVSEGSNATFTFSLNALSALPVSFTVSSADDSALSPGDYIPITDVSVEIPAGELSATLSITTNDDSIFEPNQSFNIILSEIVGAESQSTTGHATITDNDTAPSMSISDVTVTEDQDLDFTVTLDAACEQEITLSYETSDITATAGSDYLAANTTLVIPEGQGNGTITIDVTDDSDWEPSADETLSLTLSSPSHGTLSISSATGTIQDNDRSPFTWTGLGVDDNWSTGGNWNGGTPPGASDNARFDDYCTNCNVTVDVAISVASFYMETGYTGTITQGSGNTVTVGSQDFTMKDGTFNGSNADFTINSNMDLIGGNFNAPSATINILKNFSHTGTTIDMGTSTVRVFGTGSSNNSSISLNAGASLYNLHLDKGYSGGPDVTISGNIAVSNNLTVNFGYVGSSFTGDVLEVSGDVLVGESVNSSSAKIKLVGSGDQTYHHTGGGGIGHLEFASTGGTITLLGTVKVRGDLTHTSGTVDTSASTIRLMGKAMNSNVNLGSLRLNHLDIHKGFDGAPDVYITGTIYVDGDLDISMGFSGDHIYNGTIDVKGDVSVAGAGGTGTVNLLLSGHKDQTISHTAGGFPGGTLTIDKRYGEVKLLSDISLTAGGQDLHIINGDLNMRGYDLTVPAMVTIEQGNTLFEKCGTLTRGSLVANGTHDTTCASPVLTINDVEADESGTLSFTAEIDRVSGTDVTFDFTTTDGSATTAGTDYTSDSGSLTITAGTTELSIQVVLNDDAASEADEYISVDLSNHANCTLGDSQGIGYIIDNEPKTFTWTGLGADSNWSTVGNWYGGAAPGTGDTAIFDSACTNCDATIDTNIDVAGIVMKSPYSGTITQSTGQTIDIGTSGLQVLGGSFLGSDSDIMIQNGTFVMKGNEFQSTSGLLKVYMETSTDGDHFTVHEDSTFLHNNGHIHLHAHRPWNCGTTVLALNIPGILDVYDFTFSGKTTGCGGGDSQNHIPDGRTLIVNNNLSLDGGHLTGAIDLYGNLSASTLTGDNDFALSYATVNFIGTANQTYNIPTDGKPITTLIIDKPSGTVTPVNAANGFVTTGIRVEQGSFQMPTGLVNIYQHGHDTDNIGLQVKSGASLDANGGSLLFYGRPSTSVSNFTLTVNLEEPVVFNDVEVNLFLYGGRYILLDIDDQNFIVGGSFTHTDGRINGGGLELRGNASLNSTFADPGNATISMTGTGGQTLYQTGNAPTGDFTVNKSAGAVTFQSNINLNGSGHAMHVTDGSIDMGGYDLTIDTQLTLSSGTDITLSGGNLTVNSVPIFAGPYSSGTINP